MKFETWFTVADEENFARMIEADAGARTLAQVLDLTGLHPGQHLRQLYWLMEQGGVTPIDRLTDDQLAAMGMNQLPDDLF